MVANESVIKTYQQKFHQAQLVLQGVSPNIEGPNNLKLTQIPPVKIELYLVLIS